MRPQTYFSSTPSGHPAQFTHSLLKLATVHNPLKNSRYALAQKIAADGIGRDKNVRGLGVKMVGGGAEKSETFLRNLQVTGTLIGGYGG